MRRANIYIYYPIRITFVHMNSCLFIYDTGWLVVAKRIRQKWLDYYHDMEAYHVIRSSLCDGKTT